MVGLAVVADFRVRRRCQMVRVGGRGVVLERLVVRGVVNDAGPGSVRVAVYYRNNNKG